MMYRQRRDMIEEMMINSFGPGLVAPNLFTIMIGQKTKKNKLFKKRASGLWGVDGGASTT